MGGYCTNANSAELCWCRLGGTWNNPLDDGADEASIDDELAAAEAKVAELRRLKQVRPMPNRLLVMRASCLGFAQVSFTMSALLGLSHLPNCAAQGVGSRYEAQHGARRASYIDPVIASECRCDPAGSAVSPVQQGLA